MKAGRRQQIHRCLMIRRSGQIRILSLQCSTNRIRSFIFENALICTQGGHLTETLQVMDAFEGNEVSWSRISARAMKNCASLHRRIFARILASAPWFSCVPSFGLFASCCANARRLFSAPVPRSHCHSSFGARFWALKRFFSRAGAVCTALPVPASCLPLG